MGSPLEPQLSFGAFSPTSPLAFGTMTISPTLLVLLPFKVHLVAFSETTWPPGSHLFLNPLIYQPSEKLRNFQEQQCRSENPWQPSCSIESGG